MQNSMISDHLYETFASFPHRKEQIKEIGVELNNIIKLYDYLEKDLIKEPVVETMIGIAQQLEQVAKDTALPERFQQNDYEKK